MKTFNLSTLIKMNEIAGQQILIELLVPYKKSLYTYYKDLFCCEPVLMVTSVMNAAQYGQIVPINEFMDCVINYIGDNDCMNEENENFAAWETICFNSMPLRKL